MTGRSFRRWLLLDGNRHVVAGSLLVVVFLVLVGLGHLGVVDVEEPAAVRGVAGGLVPGLFTFLSIVLAINQLVLSQEFGSADEIETRVREIRGFRQEVEVLADEAPSPVLPTAFLALIVRTLESKVAQLEESVDPELDHREPIAAFAETVRSQAHRAGETLTRTDPGRINAILPVLEYPDSQHLYEARHLRNRYDETLSEETRLALGSVIDTLELFGVARTHFRSTYTQRVLARLSRLLLYTGIPALVAAFVMNLLATGTGPALLDRYRLVVVSVLLTVSLAPLAVLFAYILRIATVSERTIAVGPFVSRPNTDGDER